MTPHTVRCFGGPLHDKVVTVDTFPFLAPDDDPPSWLSYSIDDPPEMTDSPRCARYDLERFWLHDDANCRNKWLPVRTRNVLCTEDACRFVGEVAVADGYNAQIVADVAAGLWGLVTAAIGAGWHTPKVAPR